MQVNIRCAVAITCMTWYAVSANARTDPSALRQRTENMIAELNTVVATRNRQEIGKTLKSLLADQAHVRLEITYPPIVEGSSAPVGAQDFNKNQFISSFTGYMTPMVQRGFLKLRNFHLNTDEKTAVIVFDSQGADLLFYGQSSGAPMNHRKMDMACRGRENVSAKNVLLNDVQCKVYLAEPTQSRED
jgi:hypothetical protein